MRTLTVAIGLVFVLGCEERSETPPPAPQPAPSPSAARPAFPPAACSGYIAAIEELKACAKVSAGTRDIFLGIFADDQPALTGKRPAPPGALEALCGAREQNIQSVLTSQCGPALAERSVAELQTELDKTMFAIAASRAVLNDPGASVNRTKLEAQLKALEEAQKTIEALIAQKSASQPKPELPPGVTEECLKNPLAKGCM